MNLRYRDVLAFFLLTFTVTWTTWLGSEWLRPGNTGFLRVGGPVFLLGVFAPAIVAIALTALNEGRGGLARLLAPVGHWQVGARWYAFALGYMVAVRLIAAVIHRIALGDWPRFGETPVVLMMAAILVSTWVQAGEEIGWRGYALPRMARHLGLGPASAVLGGIWAVWHLPLFFIPNAGSTGQSFPIYLLHVTAISVAMGWLYWRTGGSLLLVMLMHASINNTSEIIPAAVPGAADPWAVSGSSVAWATVAVSWVIAAVLLVRMGSAGRRPGPDRVKDPYAAFSGIIRD